MFESDKAKHITQAVASELSPEYQQFILDYIGNHQETLTDYLQVFDFNVENNQQWLVQRQEVPERETTIFLNLNNSKPINRKAWVMDQGDHVMILFPKDY